MGAPWGAADPGASCSIAACRERGRHGSAAAATGPSPVPPSLRASSTGSMAAEGRELADRRHGEKRRAGGGGGVGGGGVGRGGGGGGRGASCTGGSGGSESSSAEEDDSLKEGEKKMNGWKRSWMYNAQVVDAAASDLLLSIRT